MIDLWVNIFLGGILVVLLFVMQSFARTVQQLATIVREMEMEVGRIQQKIAVHDYILMGMRNEGTA